MSEVLFRQKSFSRVLILLQTLQSTRKYLDLISTHHHKAWLPSDPKRRTCNYLIVPIPSSTPPTILHCWLRHRGHLQQPRRDAFRCRGPFLQLRSVCSEELPSSRRIRGGRRSASAGQRPVILPIISSPHLPRLLTLSASSSSSKTTKQKFLFCLEFLSNGHSMSSTLPNCSK